MLTQALAQTYGSLVRYLPFLAVGTLVAALVRVHVDQRALARTLARYARSSVFIVTLFATLTPFCSCGTIAVVLSMIAATTPWGPVVAFMVSSPLMSPSQYIYTAGVMGWGFASGLLLASIVLGVGAGYVADALDKRGLLKDQARLGNAPATGGADRAVARSAACGPGTSSGGCASDSATPCRPGTQVRSEARRAGSGCGCGTRYDGVDLSREAPRWSFVAGLGRIAERARLGETVGVALRLGLRILLFFVGFSYVGHVLTLAFPTAQMLALFGQGRFHSVPLAATLGVPLYINAEVSMPVIRSFVEMGMSPGAALALTITGAGTSIGAITGAFIIAKGRVVGLVLASLWVGAVLAGYLYEAAPALAWAW